VPKAVNHSGFYDQHNCPQRDSIPGPCALQSSMLLLDHCNLLSQTCNKFCDTRFNVLYGKTYSIHTLAMIGRCSLQPYIYSTPDKWRQVHTYKCMEGP